MVEAASAQESFKNEENDEPSRKSKRTSLLPCVEIWLESLRRQPFPLVIEWTLAWIVILLFSIRYCWDYIHLVVNMWALKRSPKQTWCRHIPLTTIPQTQSIRSLSARQALDQLKRELLQSLSFSSSSSSDPESSSWTDEHLIQILQTNPNARRLASLVMVQDYRKSTVSENGNKIFANQNLVATAATNNQNTKGTNSTYFIQDPLLLQQLERIWPILLELPPMQRRDPDSPQLQNKDDLSQFRISLIIPAYRERYQDLKEYLQQALGHCKHPKYVQVIVVNGGECSGIATWMETEQERIQQNQYNPTKDDHHWGQIQLVSYTGTGGRGGCLNYGAAHATGTIFTFLHSDTRLPKNWDGMIQQVFECNYLPQTTRKVHACAFSMGIDLTERGLNGGRYPPGIVGVYQVLGFLRCHLCRLPYGDSTLSFPASYFCQLGGFPDQPLMEDYEIISLLRKRAQILPETLVVFTAKAYCSPRRWQAYGVPYTLLVNALCIHRYNAGMLAEELVGFYYKRPCKKIDEKSN